jgi:drug/metabolite transporter (DMT)-like permease
MAAEGAEEQQRRSSETASLLAGAGSDDDPPEQAPVNTQDIPKGIALQILATMLFALSHASIKELGVIHPELTVLVPLWLRYCIFVWFAVPVATRCSRAKLRATWRTRAPVLQLCRSFLNVAEVGLIYVAVPHLPLADANAVMALMNIIVTLLAAMPCILGEHLGLRRAACILGGFCGSLLIFRPGVGVFNPWSLVVLLSATLAAIMIVMTRVNARYDSSDTILLWTALLALLWTSLAMPFYIGLYGWPSISLFGLGLVATAGLASTIGDYLWIAAVSIAPASVLMPFQYAMFAWACAWGYVIFEETPSSLTTVGAVMIAGAGILSWRFEQQESKRRDGDGSKRVGKAGAAETEAA